MPKDAQTLYDLGTQHLTGQRHPKNDKKAARHFKSAAGKGHMNAQFQLSHMYEVGIGVTQNKKKSAKYCKLAAKQGHVDAQSKLGLLYTNGIGIPKNDTKAFYYSKLAADQGNYQAQRYLGFLYESGRGVEKNDKEAVRYFRLSAKQGNAIAQCNLARMYEEGLGVKQDAFKAVKYYKLSAKKGNTIAQLNLGVLYRNGIGVKKSKIKAIYYLELAANPKNGGRGDFTAQYQLALLYDHGGKEIEKNDSKAFAYYKLAADQNHSRSQFYLSLLYENGRGVVQNHKLAMFYLQSAASQNDRNAQHYLSLKYSIGHGVKQNFTLANYYHKMATTVDKHDAFRKFAKKRKTKSLKTPALFIEVHEKQDSEVTLQGLGHYLVSPNVLLRKSYVPGKPPKAKIQRGNTCGLDAAEVGLIWGNPNCEIPPAQKNSLHPSKEEKEKNKHIISLRQTAKKNGSVIGEVFNIHCLENTIKEHGFECSVIKMNRKENHTYTKQIRETIKIGYSVILPMDSQEDFPGIMGGTKLHYGLAWGYIYKDNQYHFLVTQDGAHYLWSANALQQSHKQLPTMSPLKGKYYKNRENDAYFPIKKYMDIPEKDIRTIPAAKLTQFKFTGLAIPTNEKNFLVLDKANNQDLRSAVKSSDFIILKLLLETKATLTPSPKEIKKLEKIAKRKGDHFSLSILNETKSKKTESLYSSESKVVNGI